MLIKTYLGRVLRILGFDEKWIGWMRLCFRSVTYSIQVNEDSGGPIVPGRGLRQGDPLSPSLFILCKEGLSASLNAACSVGSLHGNRVYRGALSISHLLFAYDCLLF